MGAENISAETLRLLIFFAVLVIMALFEWRFPKKHRTSKIVKRWFANISMALVSTLSMRLVMPIVAVSIATIMTQNGWGLFNMLGLPSWLSIILSLILLDMLIYWQHVASHKLPFLWAFHKVHHADRDIDASTGIRFHPLEIMFSMAYKIVCVSLLGAPAEAVFVFEVLLSSSAIFNHANLRLPKSLDSVLRAVIVTPDMHRVHHSTVIAESNRNFGFCLPYWDHLFNTYLDQPSLGHIIMSIGLKEYQDERPSSALWLLLLPFDKKLAAMEKRRD